MAKKYQILVVEDDENSFLYILFSLEEKKYQIHRAKNGLDAVKLIESSDFQFDLVLMDIRLPLLDGFNASKEIRKIYPKIPIIVQTAYTRENIEQNLSEIRIECLLIKPFTPEDLSKAVDSVLGKINESSEEIKYTPNLLQ